MAANLEAVQVLKQLRAQVYDATGRCLSCGGSAQRSHAPDCARLRPASSQEQKVLARWGAWGAVPALFDEARAEWEDDRRQLRHLLTDEEYAAARRTTINAHYTDPAYVRQMWTALADLGFQTGAVLEPGCGAGTFIGMAPPGAEMVGVELDPISADIAAALYPHAHIRGESFAETTLPRGHFDAVIGNVPFADLRLHDPVHNPGRHSIHNHFIIKSLNLLRPGGLAAFLTSRYTMDTLNPAARREMAELGDLLGAIRLPEGAHRRAAGTDVVTDLLIFRRRLSGEPARETGWERSTPTTLDGEQVTINDYFHQHPQRVLGTLALGHGMYSAHTLRVLSDDANTAQRLREQLTTITAQARSDGLVLAPDTPHTQRPTTTPVATAGQDLWDGHIGVGTDRRSFTQLIEGVHAPLAVPKARTSELRALLHLRDLARETLTLETESLDDTEQLATTRAQLHAAYSSYTSRYGPINRFTLRSTGRISHDTGEPVTARIMPPVMRIFRTDPFFPLVCSLEHFDEDTGTATPATILTERVVLPRQIPRGADTAEEALTLSLEVHGRPDLAYMADLLGVEEGQARQRLSGLVYDDPTSGHLTAAADYLSGNVRIKLTAARKAAATDESYRENVTALEEVQPAPLGADEILPRIGAVWIDPATYAAFLAEHIEDPNVGVENPAGSMWEVKAAATFKAQNDWGTRRMPAGRLFQACLEQRAVTITDELEDGTRIVNPTETEAARDKQDALQERFAEWLWEEPERTARLVEEYNQRFNAIVLRDYTEAGNRLRLPGLAATFTPLPHQRSAVARMINEPATGLFHEVGAGKTSEMVIGVMELGRLGMVNKPCVVVPNHMLEQFSREWMQRYPQARLLAASSQDLRGDHRRRFVAKAATNDWDAIVMTRGAFERIPVSAQVQADYHARELEGLRAALERAKGGALSIKRLERRVAAEEERIKERLAGADDPGLTFEQTGIDYLVVDEAHDYKNLRTISAIPGASILGSKRASDLHMKLEYLRHRHGHRVATFATATPLANSVTEAHVMQRYLRPDLLSSAGVLEFDTWAATFGQTITEIEMGVAGGFRQKSRFAKFQNVPEMLRLWHTFADVKTAEDLQLPIPDLAERADGQRAPVTALLPSTPTVTAYVGDLAERAERVKSRGVDPHEDNMLKITSDGRKAALDMRLIDPAAAETNAEAKVSAAAVKIAAIWRQNAHREYHDDTGTLSPVPGALQIVFCDLGTPSEHWNVYDELRRQLIGHGLPASQVRFIHEASKSDQDKARLFAACRSGQVSVLVGSTTKMGIGTNIQRRAVALHHLDCPWRPADLQQREGRLRRQGNENDEVSIYRWVVEGSFDGYSWQTVERKQRFINQIMRGSLDVREVEDIGDAALSYAEVKALASGNPLLIDRAAAAADIARMERLERAHHRNLAALTATAQHTTHTIDQATQDIPQLEEAARRVRPTTGEKFAMRVGAHTYTDRTKAADALAAWLHQRTNDLTDARHARTRRDLGTLAEVAGHTILVSIRPPILGWEACLEFSIEGAPRTTWPTPIDHGNTHPSLLGLVRQLENRVAGIGDLVTSTQAEKEAAEHKLAEVHLAQGKPFKYADDLAHARDQLTLIDQQIADRERQSTNQPTTANTREHDTDNTAPSPARPDPTEEETPAAEPETSRTGPRAAEAALSHHLPAPPAREHGIEL